MPKLKFSQYIIIILTLIINYQLSILNSPVLAQDTFGPICDTIIPGVTCAPSPTPTTASAVTPTTRPTNTPRPTSTPRPKPPVSGNSQTTYIFLIASGILAFGGFAGVNLLNLPKKE